MNEARIASKPTTRGLAARLRTLRSLALTLGMRLRPLLLLTVVG